MTNVFVVLLGFLAGLSIGKSSMIEGLQDADRKGLTIRQYLDKLKDGESGESEDDDESDPLPVALLGKIRDEAAHILDFKLKEFSTTNGEVTSITNPIVYGWAFDWMLNERLDLVKDRQKIVSKIARMLWKREKREYWTKKLRGDGVK